MRLQGHFNRVLVSSGDSLTLRSSTSSSSLTFSFHIWLSNNSSCVGCSNVLTFSVQHCLEYCVVPLTGGLEAGRDPAIGPLGPGAP